MVANARMECHVPGLVCWHFHPIYKCGHSNLSCSPKVINRLYQHLTKSAVRHSLQYTEHEDSSSAPISSNGKSVRFLRSEHILLTSPCPDDSERDTTARYVLHDLGRYDIRIDTACCQREWVSRKTPRVRDAILGRTFHEDANQEESNRTQTNQHAHLSYLLSHTRLHYLLGRSCQLVDIGNKRAASGSRSRHLS